jgi:hypothetical protein
MRMIVLVLLSVDGQLQHRSGLATDELRNLQNLPVREFQRIMLDVRIIYINLPEARDLVINTSLARKLNAKKTAGAVVLNVFVKGEFRSRQQADRQFRRAVMNYKLGAELTNGGEAAHV